MTKICKICGVPKRLETEFYAHKQAKDGFRGECKECTKKRTDKYRRENPDKVRRYRIRYDFGLEQEEYEKLLAGGCSACGSKEKLTLDHCHSTGSHRGALCRNCNVVLGLVKDSPVTLRSLANYLDNPPLEPKPSKGKRSVTC